MIRERFFQRGARHRNHLALEYFTEMRNESWPDFLAGDCAIQHALERRGALPGDAARNDQIKVSQIGGHIVREAVRSDPAAQVHAKRRELFFAGGVIHPNSVVGRDAASSHAEIGRGANHHFFELLDVPAHVAAMLREIQDGIADDLAGAVIGDVAAAIARMEGDVHLREQAFAGTQVFAFAIAAESDHVRMLAEQQDIGNRAGFARFHCARLQRTCRGIGQQPQIHYPAGWSFVVQVSVAPGTRDSQSQ